MPISFIFFWIIFGVGVLATLGVAIGARGDDNYNGLLISTILFFGVAGGLALFSASATIVPTRAVGVEVSFGKPVGQLDNGFHLVAPWHRVEKFDTSVQTLVMKGDGRDADNPCVTVRLGNQTTACVDVNRAQWNIDPAGDVIELYRRYKAFDRIEQNVVAGQITNALVNEFADFDPLAGVNGGDTAPKTGAQLSSEALAKVQAAVGSGIHVDSLLLFTSYDPTTQSKLNDYAKALAETRIAAQGTLTAQQQAKANKALAEQPSVNNGGVQYQNCLQLVRDLAARNQLSQLPPTFNCGDPRSQVIVQAPK